MQIWENSDLKSLISKIGVTTPNIDDYLKHKVSSSILNLNIYSSINACDNVTEHKNTVHNL